MDMSKLRIKMQYADMFERSSLEMSLLEWS